MGFKPVPAVIAIAIGLLIWFVIPVPAGVTANAWHLLALFVGTIAAIIGKVMPIGALSMVAIALVASFLGAGASLACRWSGEDVVEGVGGDDASGPGFEFAGRGGADALLEVGRHLAELDVEQFQQGGDATAGFAFGAAARAW